MNTICVTRRISSGLAVRVSFSFGDCRVALTPSGTGTVTVCAESPGSDQSCALADVYVRCLRKYIFTEKGVQI